MKRLDLAKNYYSIPLAHSSVSRVHNTTEYAKQAYHNLSLGDFERNITRN